MTRATKNDRDSVRREAPEDSILSRLIDDSDTLAELESMICEHMVEWEDQPASHHEVMEGFKAIWAFVSRGLAPGVTVVDLPQSAGVGTVTQADADMAGFLGELIDHESSQRLISGQPTMPIVTDERRRAEKVKVLDADPTTCVHGRPADGLCPHCIGEERDASLDGAPAYTPLPTQLQLDQAAIGRPSLPDNDFDWMEVGANKHGYYPAGYPTPDQYQAHADADFINRARIRWPALVEAVVDHQSSMAELVRRYREWAAMKTCTPAVRELLRRISDDIEERVNALTKGG